MYGITPEGFVPKRLADIKAEMEEDLKLIFGNGIDLSSSSVFGQFIGVYAERESLLWEQLEADYNSHYPSTSFDQQLSQLVTLTGITRKPATKSSVNLTFFGDEGAIVPAGSIFSVDGNSLSRFILEQDITIGAGKNAVQRSTFSLVPDTGSFKYSFSGSETVAMSHSSTSQDIEDALNGLSELSTVAVAGDFSVGFTITFENDDGLKEQPLLTIVDNILEQSSTAITIENTEFQAGYPNRVINSVVGESTGSLAAPSGSLTVIENPVTGLDSINNDLDATLGSNIESDAELKIRREESLQRAGAAVLGAIVSALADLDSVVAVVGFENITLITDEGGRPAKSFEMVVQGGDEEEIATTIWDTKPAGIEYYGSETYTIIDNDGFERNVKFSRPTGIEVYIEVDLTTDDNFPNDGLSQVENLIVEYGNSLGIGQDVIVYPKLICSFADVPGITDLAIRIGTAPNPTLDDNIAIAAQEISEWDTSRTLITQV